MNVAAKLSKMKRDIKAILFDLDGTLADTADDFVKVLNIQRQRHGQPALDPKLIRDTVSDGARALTHLAFGGHEGEADFESKRQELLDLYLKMVGDAAMLFPGMAATLEYLEANDIVWGIVTNKPRKYAVILIERLNLLGRCATLVCPDDVALAKPHPEGLLKAATSLSLDANTCIYVGDHLRDIEAGVAANMRTVSARYGYIEDTSQVNNWGADAIIDSPLELVELLGKNLL